MLGVQRLELLVAQSPLRVLCFSRLPAPCCSIDRRAPALAPSSPDWQYVPWFSVGCFVGPRGRSLVSVPAELYSSD